MNNSRLVRLFVLAQMFVSTRTQSQVPFDLDPTFRTAIDTWNVSSILPLANGDVIISGQIKFPGDFTFRAGALLNSDGSRDLSFPDAVFMGGKLTPWNDRVYAANGNGVRRMFENGTLDPVFIFLDSGPYFSTFQGGDYHVFPDGRVVLGGRHILNDTVRGYVGPHCLCWFSSEGYLDTTRIHRPCSGVLFHMQELPDGRFLGSGTTGSYDNQPASNIFRFNADGSLDPTFQANVTFGRAFGFLPLADGRVIAGGRFGITGMPDTLALVRFMPDGSLDPAFNNLLDLDLMDMTGTNGIVSSITALNDGRLIIAGAFELVQGELRQSICLLDSSGNLIDDFFWGPGCGDYVYQGFTYGSLEGITSAPDGNYYIWGAYHSYDDGTTNDTTQRMVSRLYGLDVGVRESQGPRFAVHPNPSVGSLTIALEELPSNGALRMRDAMGREVLSQRIANYNTTVDMHALGDGVYLLELFSGGKHIGVQRVVVQH